GDRDPRSQETQPPALPDQQTPWALSAPTNPRLSERGSVVVVGHPDQWKRVAPLLSRLQTQSLLRAQFRGLPQITRRLQIFRRLVQSGGIRARRSGQVPARPNPRERLGRAIRTRRRFAPPHLHHPRNSRQRFCRTPGESYWRHGRRPTQALRKLPDISLSPAVHSLRRRPPIAARGTQVA